MKRPTLKIGIVNIRDIGEGRWLLRYCDPETGADVRKKLAGYELSKIKKIAAETSAQALVGNGFRLGKSQHAPAIKDALADAIKLSNARDYINEERMAIANRFILWLAERYPAVRSWDQLKPAMVLAYKQELEKAGKAYDTVRLRLAPIQIAWRLMSENYPDLVRPMPRLRLVRGVKAEIECLEAQELVILLDWLKAHASDLWPMACLQALCGLRTHEAAALRRQDVDLEAGTVAITDTGHHAPKTRDSYRTIPVCREALDALKEAINSQKVIPPTGELFLNEDGERWTFTALTHRWSRALKHLAATPTEKVRSHGKKLTLNPHGLGIPRLAQIPPRKLRAAFATMAVGRLNLSDRVLKAYMGHAAGDMLGGHYLKIKTTDLRSVSDAMNTWREIASKVASEEAKLALSWHSAVRGEASCEAGRL